MSKSRVSIKYHKIQSCNICYNKIRIWDIIIRGIIYFCVTITMFVAILIVGYTMFKGVEKINWEFLSTKSSVLNNTYGILPSIINTIYIIILTLIIATPIGVGGAIYLNEYAKKGSLTKVIEFTISILSGIPSIIYGLFGFLVFNNILKLGYSILSGALTLSIMVLPLIIKTTEESLKNVPIIYREGAIGLGASKWYMIYTIIIPSSIDGIITGVMLSIGRIIGETAVLLFTSGIGTYIIKSVVGHMYISGATLSVELYKYVNRGENEIAFAIAGVLIIVVILLNLSIKIISEKLKVEK